jgi:hypothetical protein
MHQKKNKLSKYLKKENGVSKTTVLKCQCNPDRSGYAINRNKIKEK